MNDTIINDIAITTTTGSVYEALGAPGAAEMLVKAQLAQQIGHIVKGRRLSQVQVAELVGLPQPRVSALLRGQFRGISEAKMIEVLNRLGRDVQIVVKRSRRGEGRTSVVLA